MQISRFAILSALIALVASACASPAPTTAQRAAAAPPGSESGRTLIAVLRLEPRSLGLRSVAGGAFEGYGPAVRLFNADLALVDDHANPIPYLAEALPQLNTDTWR